MNQTNTDKPSIERGEYLAVTDYGHEGRLIRASRDSFLQNGTEKVAGTFVFGSGDAGDEIALPVREVEPAEADDEAEYRAEFRTYDRHDAKNGGVYMLQPDAAEHFCPVCGSNAVRWASDPMAGVGGEWCDTCGYERESP